jgi:assimilatory nitrate reductase catalytic subunit
MYHTTETARMAHLILPAAGWGEKEGTFINSERRIGLVKKVARAPGQALADFHIFRLIAHYWGCEHLFREWTSPQAAFQILKRLSAGQPCDFTGIEDFRHVDACGGIQWPFPSSEFPSSEFRVSGSEFRVPSSASVDHTPKPETRNPELGTRNSEPVTERRLFADGRFFHADGKARFLFDAPRELPEKPDAQYPFVLLTGRGTSAQWHTQTRTGKSDVLRKLHSEKLCLEIHPQDAARLRLPPGAAVRVISRRGAVTAHALVTATVQPGQVYLPMHDAATNVLTHAVFDPHSRQPGYKFSAVRLERVAPASRTQKP